MRDHIRREALQAQAVYWLVPVAFAAAALAAVALIEPATPAGATQVSAPAPASTEPMPVAAPANDGALLVTEHVEAF
jgi:hypothetical protein